MVYVPSHPYQVTEYEDAPVSLSTHKPRLIDIISSYFDLEDNTKPGFIALHCHMTSSQKEDARKAIPRHHPEGYGYLQTISMDAFSKTASRNNHSCIPSLYYSWDPDLNQGRFHATRLIQPEEELTRSYLASGHWSRRR